MGGVRNTDPATCRMAFEQMKEDGTLSKRRLEAIECLSTYESPPTVGEMAKRMQTNRNNLATRMSELEHLGVVEKCGERPCYVTEKECTTWWMTGGQPTGEIPKNINTTEIVKMQRDKAWALLEEMEIILGSIAGWLEEGEDIVDRRHLARGAKRIRSVVEDLKQRKK